MDFRIGQRWISHSETQLGLGIITDVSNRRVKILYPAASESRIYAIDNAPLSRIKYAINDTIIDGDEQSIIVTNIEENDGLISYRGQAANGEEKQILELDLSCYVHFTTPLQRLFSGQLDKNKNFSLRIETLQQLHKLQQSPVKGLLGSRTDLLPHQIYIANNVANRHAPRVLLADEVGLGKTIEAGMILHHQIHTGKTTRVLIVVPDSLIHQWLVEMLRKFNLNFSIFNHERINALIDEGLPNPFESEQQVICPLSLISEQTNIQEYLIATHWDTIVIDEAHHLAWNEIQSSPEYQCIEKLSKNCASLLLLTATPEQVGLESHFARLRLLDPARFHDLEEYKREQKNLESLNELIQTLLSKHSLNEEQDIALKTYLGDEYDDNPNEIIKKLLDRHGTGRVLFRNSRATIQGFPSRNVHQSPLTLNKSHTIDSTSLYPEVNFSDDTWLNQDPRVAWLVEKVRSLKPNKVLVICHHASTAIQLDNYLNLRMGIRSASFYEDLSIIERDRAAAYFAEGSNPDDLNTGDGAQVLICSEIGSEGRNFQFSHHLILFDLPLNPDLLEQRIGRLDRIGQKHPIQIHIPYIVNSSQEVLFRWLHEGINLFNQSCSAGYEIYKQFAQQLNYLITHPPHNNDKLLDELINQTRKFTKETVRNLQQGRDKLLEINSCNKKVADILINEIKAYDSPVQLSNYMELVFDQFGVDSDFHSEHSYVLHPSEHMHENFPGLREEGNTITFDRNKALSRDDMEFLSWEHPMVSESMEMIQHSQFGNTALAMISLESLPKGTLFVETWYAIHTIADKKLQLDRFLPLHPIRFLLDSSKKNYSQILPYEKLSALCGSLPKKTALAIAEKTRTITQSIVDTTQILADEKVTAIKSAAKALMEKQLSAELERLIALQKVNPSIRQEEILYLESVMQESSECIDRAKYQLQAVRIIVNN